MIHLTWVKALRLDDSIEIHNYKGVTQIINNISSEFISTVWAGWVQPAHVWSLLLLLGRRLHNNTQLPISIEIFMCPWHKILIINQFWLNKKKKIKKSLPPLQFFNGIRTINKTWRILASVKIVKIVVTLLVKGRISCGVVVFLVPD